MVYTYILFAIDQPHLKDTGSVNNVAELLMKGGFIMIPIILHKDHGGNNLVPMTMMIYGD